MTYNNLTNPLNYIKAGKAIFTVKNEETGNRFTYKVKKAKGKDIWFVFVLNGPDNYTNYAYMGSIFDSTFKRTKKSKVGEDAISFKAFSWLHKRLSAGAELPKSVVVHHEGRCGRCGKRLTVPGSIESGYGPECIKHIR